MGKARCGTNTMPSFSQGYAKKLNREHLCENGIEISGELERARVDFARSPSGRISNENQAFSSRHGVKLPESNTKPS
jgi:hypothetical protein